MPTIIQLQAEAVWRAQYVPPILSSALITPLRTFYKLGPAAVGAPGDENHLYGRHRSYNWDKNSTYCTNPSYGTTDARDKRGDLDWYRAVDVGITGQTLYDACHRVDLLVRSGQLPGLAEWFGTFDGKTVVGWYQGHPSSSDSSHLWHLHVGFWNEFANDETTMRRVYDAITGEYAMANNPYTLDNLDRWLSAVLVNAEQVTGVKDPSGKVAAYPNWLHVPIPTTGGATISDEQLAAVAEAAKEGAEAGAPTHEELVAAANEAEDS